MNLFYQERQKRHQTHMMRYLKYVFNDHFVLLAFFIIGGIGLYYSQWLKSIPSPFTWGYLLTILFLWGIVSLGHLATLLKPADLIFLLSKEKQMIPYIKQAIKHSRLVAYGIQIVGTAFIMPLWVVSSKQAFQMYFILVIGMILLKEVLLWCEALSLYRDINRYIAIAIRSLVMVNIVVMVYLPIIGLILALLLMVGTVIYGSKQFQEHILDWDLAIHKEEQRLLRIYKFINLFTDVPEVASTVKRRVYLDWMLKWIKLQQEKTYDYLLWRHFLRSNEYSGLTLRLLLIGLVLVLINHSGYLNLALLAGILYLWLFQMIPLVHSYSYMVLLRLYPLSDKIKVKGMQRLLIIVGVAFILILALALLLSGILMTQWLLTIGVLIIELLGLVYLYVPKKIMK